jgi:hypothetical protein
MIPILPFIEPLTRLATAALEHVNLRKAGLAAGGKPDAARLKELEESDFEQAELISQLSETVERLAEAVQSQIQANKKREAMLWRLVYVSLGLGVGGMAVALIALFR